MLLSDIPYWGIGGEYMFGKNKNNDLPENKTSPAGEEKAEKKEKACTG